MEAVVAIQAVTGGTYLLCVTVVGFRLLHLAQRSRAVPELLLGLALVLGGTFGGPLEAVSISAKREIGPALAGRMLLAGKIFGFATLACHATFIWRVFRPREGWAPALVAALLAFPLAALWGFASNGAFAGAEIPLLWFWVDLFGRLGASCWLIFEGAHYYALMKRRLRVGLADPVVTNRFILWTLAGVFSIVLLLTAVPPMFLDTDQDILLLVLDQFAFSAAGMAVSALYFLIFLPPAAYRRRLRRAAETVG
jgi:hypothetical protein